MNSSNKHCRSQLLVFSLLFLFSFIGLSFLKIQNQSVDANHPEPTELQSSLILKSAHSQIYKVGTEANFQDAFQVANQRKQIQHTVRKNELVKEKKLAEQKAQEEKVEQERLALKEAEQIYKEEAQQKVKTSSETQASANPSAQAQSTSTKSNSSNDTPSSNTHIQTKQTRSHNPNQCSQQLAVIKLALMAFTNLS